MAKPKTPRKKPANPAPAAPSGARYFGEPKPTADAGGFQTPVTDARYYSFLVKNAQAVPPPSRTPRMTLDEVLGPGASASIQAAGHIVFHAVGDTGPAKGPRTLNLVADRMTTDFRHCRKHDGMVYRGDKVASQPGVYFTPEAPLRHHHRTVQQRA